MACERARRTAATMGADRRFSLRKLFITASANTAFAQGRCLEQGVARDRFVRDTVLDAESADPRQFPVHLY